MSSSQWWDGAARRLLPAELREKVNGLQLSQEGDARIHAFDRASRLKVLVLYATAASCFALYPHLPRGPVTQIALILILGLFAIPYVRVFMHSQMHWGLGGGRLTSFVLDHFISLLFGVPQTGYMYGHRFHHRYDNDFNPAGLPRDLQSTYVFSKDGRPTHVIVWLVYYVFFYQIFVHLFLVMRHGKMREKLAYVMELGAILLFQAGLYRYSHSLYLDIYLPALLLAWFASGVVLYMMHAVDMREYHVHPTVDSLSPFFNTFGDNDGYHLEHSLFPALHPLHLADIHPYFDLPESQCTHRHYVIEMFVRALQFKRIEAGSKLLPEIED